jgi:hypothetical protein
MLRERGVDASATPGGKGQFDVVAEGKLVFSKHEHRRYPETGEILEALS